MTEIEVIRNFGAKQTDSVVIIAYGFVVVVVVVVVAVAAAAAAVIVVTVALIENLSISSDPEEMA